MKLISLKEIKQNTSEEVQNIFWFEWADIHVFTWGSVNMELSHNDLPELASLLTSSKISEDEYKDQFCPSKTAEIF